MLSGMYWALGHVIACVEAPDKVAREPLSISRCAALKQRPLLSPKELNIRLDAGILEQPSRLIVELPRALHSRVPNHSA